jgi:hypothetical protein
MITPIDTQSIFPCTGCNVKNARNLIRTVEDGKFTLTPEKTEEEKQLETTTFSYSKELNPEEEKRVLFLKNILAQILTMTDGQPTEEQVSRIKEIEKELEKITGVKMHSRISSTAAKIPGKTDKEKEEEQDKQARGTDPKEAIHSRMPDIAVENGPGVMQFMQRNAATAYLNNMELKPLDNRTSIRT